MTKLPGKLRRRLQHLRTLDKATLHTRFNILLDDTLYGLHHQVGTQRHQAVVHVTGGIGMGNPAFLAEDDATRVNVFVDHKGGHTRHLLPVDDRPVDRSGAAVLRQQGGMQVEGAQRRHGPHHIGQHPETDHDKKIGLESLEGFEEVRVTQLFGLQDGQALLYRIFLDGTFVHLEAASAGFIGHGHHAHHVVFLLQEGVQGRHREFGGTHIDDAGLLEEAHELTLDLAPPGANIIGIEQGGVVNGFPGKEDADGPQYPGRDKSPDKGGCGPVLGQFGAGNIHHPVQHEEEDGYDGRGAQSAFADEGAQGRADKEEDQAGECLGEAFELLHIGTGEDEIILVSVAVEVLDIHRHLHGALFRPANGVTVLGRRLPGQEALGQVGRTGDAGMDRGVQLGPFGQESGGGEGPPVHDLGGIQQLVEGIGIVPQLA